MVHFVLTYLKLYRKCYAFLRALMISLYYFSSDEEEEDDVVIPKPSIEPEEEKTLKKEEEEEGTTRSRAWLIYCNKKEALIK